MCTCVYSAWDRMSALTYMPPSHKIKPKSRQSQCLVFGGSLVDFPQITSLNIFICEVNSQKRIPITLYSFPSLPVFLSLLLLLEDLWMPSYVFEENANLSLTDGL